jgi:hypothetical protein
VLRSTCARPKARGLPSWNALPGAWQVAHSTEPGPDRRGSKNRRRPNAIASAWPDSRLLGSAFSGGGHGP